MAWHQAFGQVRPYVVRIETMNGLGTGFLFGYNKAHSVAALATAAHVIDAATEWKQPMKIWHSASKNTLYLEEENRVAWLDRTHDAAPILDALTDSLFQLFAERAGQQRQQAR
jgi:hypothetical protein